MSTNQKKLPVQDLPPEGAPPLIGVEQKVGQSLSGNEYLMQGPAKFYTAEFMRAVQGQSLHLCIFQLI
jgi:hypothetical protein